VDSEERVVFIETSDQTGLQSVRRERRPDDGETSMRVGGSDAFWIAKRLFDILLPVLLLVPLVVILCGLLVVNPIFNPGPLFFIQLRMGQNRKPFRILKFRTMRVASEIRGADDSLETHLISRFGGILRRTRIDELPQIVNVLTGEMSLIGPRPDTFSHATEFCRKIPDYRHRFQVRPGISGLAQVDHGYVQGIEATFEKARLDRSYVENASLGLEARIFFKTLYSVIGCTGR
jgi:lipopolysaccharide/colanic/teichoic acid biosynthesis glycosyltransferase